MPGKSHRKHPSRSKKKRTRQDFSLAGTQRQDIVQNQAPVSQVPTPSAKVGPLRSTMSPVRYPYVTNELRRIAVLAGAVLVILVVLYFVVP